VKELHPHLTGLEAVAFAIKLTPHWIGHRDVRPDPGVGNAELYCLSYDRKNQKEQTPTESNSVPQDNFRWRYFRTSGVLYP
jgi:hypothetical protein